MFSSLSSTISTVLAIEDPKRTARRPQRGASPYPAPARTTRHRKNLKPTFIGNEPLTDAPPPELFELRIDPEAPLVIVDVDEVLALFVRGFERFIRTHGLEMRIDRFALFQNIYRPGADEPLDTAAGRRLFDAFFETDRHDIDVAPGAAAALEALSRKASVVILTNAPAQSRPARARWLIENNLPYTLVIGAGPKGRPVAALARRTRGPVAFVDDLLPNLESVATDAPSVRRFQMVADERLRPLAPSAPDRHRRIDDWATLGPAIAQSLGI
jgi:hypothetical protein